MSFYALQVLFELIVYAIEKKPVKLFWTTLMEMSFALVGKRLEHLESGEILCLHRPKISFASSVHGKNFLKEWIQSLCSNVVDHLFVATSQSTNDRRSQTMNLKPNHLALSRDPSVH